MAVVPPLFAPCPLYVPESDLSLRDCSECRENYRDVVCEEFRLRFVRALGVEASVHELRFLSHLRVRVG